jgi:hypothetical protein
MKAGKVWGQTELLEANGVLEFHRIEAKAGGVCSKHKHKFKWNGFFVEQGSQIEVQGYEEEAENAEAIGR